MKSARSDPAGGGDDGVTSMKEALKVMGLKEVWDRGFERGLMALVISV